MSTTARTLLSLLLVCLLLLATQCGQTTDTKTAHPTSITPVATRTRKPTPTQRPTETQLMVRPRPGPPFTGRLAFISEGRNDRKDIYTITADGSDLINLTQHPATDDSPSWSPDGSLIAFVSNRDGQANVYTMRADGSELIQVTRDGGDLTRWSPDGTHLAVLKSQGSVEELAVVELTSLQPTVLFTTTDSGALDRITWSPDGTKIAIGGWSSPTMIVTVATGTHVTLDPFYSPNWFPDSEHLLGIGSGEVTSIRADGSDPNPLGITAGSVSLSPDGTQVVLARGEGFLSIANADGSNLHRLTTCYGYQPTNCYGSDVDPVWAPDSEQIAYNENVQQGRSTARGNNLIHADGNGQTFLTAGHDPVWQPVPPPGAP